MQELTTLPVLLTLLGLVALGQLFGPRGTPPPSCRHHHYRLENQLFELTINCFNLKSIVWMKINCFNLQSVVIMVVSSS